MDTVLQAATRMLDGVRAAGLDLRRLPANAAKVRLILDLRGELERVGRLRVLDVGCGGLNHPLNLWEPLVPFADRLELVGVDVDHLEPTRRRAAEIGLRLELRRASALQLVDLLGSESFDAVVSTQVLEHVQDWAGALCQMHGVLRPGGSLFLTCDSGELARDLPTRGRLVAKRGYARLASRAPGLARRLRPLASGDWELGLGLEQLGEAAKAAGFEVTALERHALRDLKDVRGGPATRLLALAFETALQEEANTEPFAHLYRILYLRARRL